MASYPFGLREDPFAAGFELSPEETRQLLQNRVSACGGDGATVFPPETCSEIHRRARGVASATLKLAEHGMLRAAAEGSPWVSAAHVRPEGSASQTRVEAPSASPPPKVAPPSPEASPLPPEASLEVPPLPAWMQGPSAPAHPSPGRSTMPEVPAVPVAQPAPVPQAAPVAQAMRVAAAPQPSPAAQTLPAAQAVQAVLAAPAVPAAPVPLSSSAGQTVPVAPARLPSPTASVPQPSPTAPVTRPMPAARAPHPSPPPDWNATHLSPPEPTSPDRVHWAASVAVFLIFAVGAVILILCLNPAARPAMQTLARTAGAEAPADLAVLGDDSAVVVYSSPAPAAVPAPAPKAAATAARAESSLAESPSVGLEVARFIVRERARAERRRLAARGLKASVLTGWDGGASVFSVVLGPFTSPAEAEHIADKLLASGLVGQARVVTLKKPASPSRGR